MLQRVSKASVVDRVRSLGNSTGRKRLRVGGNNMNWSWGSGHAPSETTRSPRGWAVAAGAPNPGRVSEPGQDPLGAAWDHQRSELEKAQLGPLHQAGGPEKRQCS